MFEQLYVPNTDKQHLLIAYPFFLKELKKKLNSTEVIFCRDAARETSELRTHHDPSGHPVCNYTMRVMQAAARELMRDQTSGGFFYTTINKLKKTHRERVEGIA